MKRFFFSVLALAAVAVGCTKSGIVELPQSLQTPIQFEPYSGKALVTKADTAGISTLQKALTEGGGIHVTGFLEEAKGVVSDYANSLYMDKDVKFVDQKWIYEGASYWPESGSLTFVAYGLNSGSAFAPVANSKTDFTFTVADEVANQKDLLVSPIMTAKDINIPTVTIKLSHLLSRVEFALKTNNEEDNDVQVLIKDVKLHGSFAKQGTVDLTDTVAVITPGSSVSTSYSVFDSEYEFGTADTDTTSYPGFLLEANTVVAAPIYNNVTFTPAGLVPASGDGTSFPTTTSTAKSASRYMMLMPGTVTAPTGGAEHPYIEVVYQLTDAEEQKAMVELVDAEGNDWTFAPGKAYKFVFTVSTTAIGFEVEVDPWEVFGDSTHTLVPEV